ncbi:uncharacterized protein C8R40DRAFT_1172393 [Lentinula edodes]|uniref:uncharacterized protein n=1 Tax=Lentinula edodes TaxID=5353 RepID=UPI001E8DA6E8|nr:uncharacterized protein C8R40DRAFT_1172393 [Lentinula edodes]KAH7873600.1 hypothetical protein C8R40DRAFT_1172393 [Lentinula edodes]
MSQQIVWSMAMFWLSLGPLKLNCDVALYGHFCASVAFRRPCLPPPPSQHSPPSSGADENCCRIGSGVSGSRLTYPRRATPPLDQ